MTKFVKKTKKTPKKQYLMCVYLFVNITRFDLYSVILFCSFLRGKSGKTHRENPFFAFARAQREFG
jgi:hypothetical protein